MTTNVWPVDAVDDAPEYTGRMLRQLFGGLLGGKSSSRPLGARSGVLNEPTLSVTTTTWTVGAHNGVLDLESNAEAGPYVYATNGETGDVTAAHATLDRLDLISVRIDDPAEGDGTTTPQVAWDYTAGTAGSGTLPSTPDRSLAFAKVSVPKSGGGSPTITFLAPYTATAGAPIRCRTSSEYPSSPVKGNRVTDDSLGGALLAWNGTKWTDVTSDTGWTTITNVSSSYTASVTPQYRVKNGILYLKGVLSRTTGNVTASESLCGLVTAARPAAAHRWIAATSGTAWVAITIGTDGTVSVFAVSASTISTVYLDTAVPID